MSNTPPDYPLLAIDTSSRRTWVGLKLSPQHLASKSEEQDPSKSLFRLLDQLLDETGTTLQDLASIVYCAGPGSMLGARTASMAIRSWRGIDLAAAKNVFFYNCLQVGAKIAAAANQAPKSGLVLTDARRSSWNALPFPDSADDSLFLISNEDLEASPLPLVTFTDFPRWTSSQAKFTELPYDPTPLFQATAFLDFIRPTENASPLTIRSNEYKRWDAKIHSVPTE